MVVCQRVTVSWASCWRTTFDVLAGVSHASPQHSADCLPALSLRKVAFLRTGLCSHACQHPTSSRENGGSLMGGGEPVVGVVWLPSDQ